MLFAGDGVRWNFFWVLSILLITGSAINHRFSAGIVPQGENCFIGTRQGVVASRIHVDMCLALPGCSLPV